MDLQMLSPPADTRGSLARLVEQLADEVRAVSGKFVLGLGDNFYTYVSARFIMA